MEALPAVGRIQGSIHLVTVSKKQHVLLGWRRDPFLSPRRRLHRPAGRMERKREPRPHCGHGPQHTLAFLGLGHWGSVGFSLRGRGLQPGHFCPWGTFGSTWRHFWLSHLVGERGWYSWRVSGKSQGGCYTPSNAQGDRPQHGGGPTLIAGAPSCRDPAAGGGWGSTDSEPSIRLLAQSLVSVRYFTYAEHWALINANSVFLLGKTASQVHFSGQVQSPIPSLPPCRQPPLRR